MPAQAARGSPCILYTTQMCAYLIERGCDTLVSKQTLYHIIFDQQMLAIAMFCLACLMFIHSLPWE